jgi:hypothetical protein
MVGAAVIAHVDAYPLLAEPVLPLFLAGLLNLVNLLPVNSNADGYKFRQQLASDLALDVSSD